VSAAFSSAGDAAQRFDRVDYLLDEGLAMALYLAVRLGKPLLLEGEPGVGKTAAAKALARTLDAPLLRLQCYEGLTAAEALYDWNYQRQMLAIRLAESRHERLADADLFTEEFLIERPILAAVRHRGANPPVLLIDEIDRADDEFEALLFEFLGEGGVTVPELGTFAATEAPIVRRTVPAATEPLIRSATEFIGEVRALELDKAPGLAETIDWVSALSALGATDLVREDAIRTVATIAKTPDDRDTILAVLEQS
jgi:MoxR-like ATPase